MEIKEKELVETLLQDLKESTITVYNDNVNTFDNVILSFVEICKHTLEQAEQCAMIIHNNGKCIIKTGELDILTDMNFKLLSRGINSEVN